MKRLAKLSIASGLPDVAEFWLRTVLWWSVGRVWRSVGRRGPFVVGTVFDASSGDPIRGASIETIPRERYVAGGGHVTEIGIATDERGRYVNLNIDTPGAYELRAAAPGYRRASRLVRATMFGVTHADFALSRGR